MPSRSSDYPKAVRKTLVLSLLFLLVLTGCPGPQNLRVAQNQTMPTPQATPIPNEQVAGSAQEQFRLGHRYAQNGDYDRAIGELQKVPDHFKDSPWRSNAWFVLGQAYTAQKKSLPALRAYRQAMDLKVGELARYAEQECGTIIEEKLDRDELTQFLNEEPAGPFAELVSFKLIQQAYTAQSFDVTANLAANFLSQWPKSQRADDVRRIVAASQGNITVNKNRIGLLVPLSGQAAAYGQRIKNGADLAVLDHNLNAPADAQMALVCRDTQTDAESAGSQAKDLVLQEKVMALLGPALSPQAPDVAKVANDYKVPLIIPTAFKEGLTAEGPYVFRNALLPERQARSLAEYAVGERHLKRFAVLYPNTPYGNLLSGVFSARVQELTGVTLTAVSFERSDDRSQTDFKEQFLALGGADPRVIKDAEQQEKDDLKAKTEKTAAAIAGLLPAYVTLTVTAAGGEAGPLPVTRTAKLAVMEFQEAGAEAAQYGLGQLFVDKLVQAFSKMQKFQVLTGRKIVNDGPPDFVLRGQVAERPGTPEEENFKFDVNMAMEKWSGNPGDAAAQGERVYVGSEGIHKHKPLQINPQNIEAVYLPAYPDEIVALADGLLFYDLKFALLGDDEWQTDRVRSSDSVEGAAYTAGFSVDNPDPSVRAFVEGYQKKYGEQPDLYAAEGYEAASLLLTAMGGATREDVEAALLRIHDFKGVCGTSAFQPADREADKKVLILGVQKGQEVILKGY